MKNYLLILFMAISISLISQSKSPDLQQLTLNQKFDSIKKKYSDTAITDKLIQIAKVEEKNNPTVSKIWINKADSLIKTFKNPSNKHKIAILLAKSRVESNTNNLDSAYSLVNDALAIGIKSLDSLLIANCFGELGIVCCKKNRHPEAIHYSSMAIRIYEKYQLKAEISQLNNLIGIVYQSIADYEKSLEYFLKSLRYAQETNDTVAL